MRDYHVLSLGAGVQSTTLFLMINEGVIQVPKDTVAVFADTQEEPKAVYAHLDWLIKNFDWPKVLIRTVGSLGDGLIQGKNSTGQNMLTIPAFIKAENGGTSGLNRRQCTREYKTAVIERTIMREIIGVARGSSLPRYAHLHQYIGISCDEARRSINVKTIIELKKRAHAHFPLLELGFTRGDCLRWLAERVPHLVPKSSCVFCPFHSDYSWLKLKEAGGADWNRAVQIDHALRLANTKLAKNAYLHHQCKPLDEVDFNPRKPSVEFAVECEGMCGV